jgi:hypothetical protein
MVDSVAIIKGLYYHALHSWYRSIGELLSNFDRQLMIGKKKISLLTYSTDPSASNLFLLTTMDLIDIFCSGLIIGLDSSHAF